MQIYNKHMTSSSNDFDIWMPCLPKSDNKLSRKENESLEMFITQ